MKKFILTILLIGIALFTVACGDSDSNDNGSSEENNTSGETSQSEDTSNESDKKEGTSETITVDHKLDETEVDVNPDTVAVFDLGILDSLDELNVDVAGLPKKIIPDYLSKYEGDEYANLGSLVEPDFEKLSEIDPDLIIISGRQSSVYDQMKEIAPTIYLGVDPTRYLDSFKENMHTLGKIFEKEDKVDEELAAIDDSIDSLSDTAQQADKNALILMANDDKISAYGPNSRYGFIHDEFGIPAVDDGIEASTHGMNVSFEYVMEQNPDLIYVIDRSAAINKGSSAEQIVENKLVKKTDAYKNDNIVYLNSDLWYLAGGGLQSVKLMVGEVADSFEE